MQACADDVTAAPAQRLEPALVLLASRVTASHLGPGLRELLDGDVDVRGHLTPEVGHGLAAEIHRRVAKPQADAKKALSVIRRGRAA